MHLLTVTIGAASNLPEDAIVNTFHFEGGSGLTGPDYENLQDMIADFYLGTPTGESYGISNMIPSAAINGTMTYKIYDLDDPKPRAPVFEEQVDGVTGWGTGPSLPTEVALVMSMHAAPTSGEIQARRRNRIYLGPLVTATVSSGLVQSVYLDRIAAAARDMLQASNASVTWTWSIWSPTNSEGYPVTGGWVDNAFDTQRRRGISATTRQLWNGSTP
uniref:Uncharacterized protein n=1 Tax=uncultured prokaryote TaxID=198431 RepID=A0A0H5Q4E7_9ZZZZ|nr:hypothetical protein [uncultured prokaryote]